MTMNEGAIDRIARVIIGLAILSLAFVGPKTVWAYLGLVPLLTSVAGYSPAYALAGIRTTRSRR